MNPNSSLSEQKKASMNEEKSKNRVPVEDNSILGNHISSMYSMQPPRLNTSAFSLPLSGDVLRNMREEFYLQIITQPNAKDLLLEKIDSVINAMVRSKQFSRYVPEVDKPVNVFQNGKLVSQIKSTITTIGTFDWNDIVSQHEKGLSRIHAIIMLVKDEHDNVLMMVIDGWSLQGTCILDRKNNILEKSKASTRCVLISDLTDCAKLCFAMETYIFSQMEGKTCAICMENIRETRMNCGHGVTCLLCSRKLQVCPICREPVDPYTMNVSMCMKTYR